LLLIDGDAEGSANWSDPPFAALRDRHELEALRASPRDTDANVWVAITALAKLYLGAYEDALNLYRRSIELSRNYPNARFNYAATLVELGRLDEAKTEVNAALTLNPNFTLRRYRDGANLGGQ
jgi:tetratricopeptide (TPR) repeat protein